MSKSSLAFLHRGVSARRKSFRDSLSRSQCVSVISCRISFQCKKDLPAELLPQLFQRDSQNRQTRRVVIHRSEERRLLIKVHR